VPRWRDEEPSGGHGRAAVQPLERQVISDDVAEHIRRLIFRGVWRPGDRIPVDEIADQLRVSRQPVRDALLVLARDGVVHWQPRLGAYVGDFDADVIRDHFEIFGLVHGVAAVRVAERADAAVIARLHELAERARRATASSEAYELMLEFAEVVNRHGRSSRQRAVMRALRRMFPSDVFRDVEGAVELARRSLPLIVASLRAGDADQVRRLVQDDHRERADLLVRHMELHGYLQAPAPVREPDAPSRRRAPRAATR
jgi:DNA-binding GntR family transcriptional regulator